jgi:hypothetical protein
MCLTNGTTWTITWGELGRIIMSKGIELFLKAKDLVQSIKDAGDEELAEFDELVLEAAEGSPEGARFEVMNGILAACVAEFEKRLYLEEMGKDDSDAA